MDEDPGREKSRGGSDTTFFNLFDKDMREQLVRELNLHIVYNSSSFGKGVLVSDWGMGDGSACTRLID